MPDGFPFSISDSTGAVSACFDFPGPCRGALLAAEAPVDGYRLVRRLHPQHEVPGILPDRAIHPISKAHKERHQRSRSMPYDRGVRVELSAVIRSLKNTTAGWTVLPDGSSSW